MALAIGWFTCIEEAVQEVDTSTPYDVTRRTINFCFTRTELVCAGETVLSAAGIFRIPPLDTVPADRRPPRT